MHNHIDLNELYFTDDARPATGLAVIEGPAPDKPLQELAGGRNNEQEFDVAVSGHDEPPIRGSSALPRMHTHAHGPTLSRMDTREHVDRYLSDRPEVAVFFRVMDDALNGIGIVFGDVVVVDPTSTPQPGDVVVIRMPDGILAVRRLEPPNLVSYFGADVFSRSEDFRADAFTIVGVAVSFCRRIR